MPNAEQVGFVGSIERVDVDVLNHIAADYIPVIASSASDRDGQSYNVNADEAAGKVAAALGAHKAIFLTDVEGWLRRPGGRADSLISRATVDEVEERLAGDRRRHAPEAGACVDAIRGGAQSAHIIDGRKPHSPAARALHRRRHRHDGDAVNLTDLQALEERYLMRTYKRAPVEFVRGEGALLWDAEGKEYLDFLAGISVCSVGHCNPDVVEAVREQAGRLMHTSNLFYTEPMVRLAERLSRVEPRRPRLLLQLGHRGQRVRDQDRPQARPPARHRGAGDRQLRARLPRPHLRRALGDPGAGRQPDAGPDAARLPLGAARTTPMPCARRSARAPPRS